MLFAWGLFILDNVLSCFPETGGSRLDIIPERELESTAWRTLGLQTNRESLIGLVWLDRPRPEVIDIGYNGTSGYPVQPMIVSSASIEISSLDLNTAYIAALNWKYSL